MKKVISIVMAILLNFPIYVAAVIPPPSPTPPPIPQYVDHTQSCPIQPIIPKKPNNFSWITDEQWKEMHKVELFNNRKKLTQDEKDFIFSYINYDDDEPVNPTLFYHIKQFIKNNWEPAAFCLVCFTACYLAWIFLLNPGFKDRVSQDLHKAIDAEAREHSRKNRKYIHYGLRMWETMIIPAEESETNAIEVTEYDPCDARHVSIVARSLRTTQELADASNLPQQNPVTNDIHEPGDLILPQKEAFLPEELPYVCRFWLRQYNTNDEFRRYVDEVKGSNRVSKNIMPLPGWLICIPRNYDQNRNLAALVKPGMRLEFFNPTNPMHNNLVKQSLLNLIPEHNYITNTILRQVTVRPCMQNFVNYPANGIVFNNAPTFKSKFYKLDYMTLTRSNLFQFDFKRKFLRMSTLTIPEHLVRVPFPSNNYRK
jgi:hypothetical protein